MQEQHLFEYAVIRIVPRIEREEFINAGVILFCKKQRYLRSLILLQQQRLSFFAPGLDWTDVQAYLSALQCIAHAEPESGPIGRLDAASRFRWLTAIRSTVVQTSRIHPGFCTDLDATLDQLARQYAS
jgi:hypothetical protein